MSAFRRRSPPREEEEQHLRHLLTIWSQGEITLDAITVRTGRRYPALRRLIQKYKIPKPPKFSY